MTHIPDWRQIEMEGYTALLATIKQMAQDLQDLGCKVQISIAVYLPQPQPSAPPTVAPAAPAHPDTATADDAKPATCPQCHGCGQVADSDSREPWTFWQALDPRREGAAVTLGVVKPIPCPTCHGSGTK
jgi:hypothetical protein